MKVPIAIAIAKTINKKAIKRVEKRKENIFLSMRNNLNDCKVTQIKKHLKKFNKGLFKINKAI
jgi:vacuolar-type H+-ATPase subunit E/Vma4